MSLQKIRKRSGQIADFDPERIRVAIGKAASATGVAEGEFFPDTIMYDVVGSLTDHFDGMETVPAVEDIQDMVEKKLVESGYFDIAKTYILYRAEHERLRAEQRLEELKKLEKNLIQIVKDDGSTEVFRDHKISVVLERVGKSFSQVDQDLILREVKKNIYDGMKAAEISKVLVMVAKSFIERDPEYSLFASSLLLEAAYPEIMDGARASQEDFDAVYRTTFKKNLKRGVEAGRIDPEMLTFDFTQIEKAFVPERDHILHYLGLQTLYDRYFVHINDQRIEGPQYFWMRVAMGLALNEKKEDREKYTVEFYNILSTLRFVNSTPTLFNAGTTHSQLSSCFLSTVEDSLSHIFKVIADNAQLSKWAGGIGNDWTNVRATGARIHGTNGKSQGVIPFLKIANDTAVAVNQGGKRKGAVVAYLECWHYDYEEFLELRKNTGDDRRRTHDMNTASWIPDLFMKRLEADGDWMLFSPDEVPELHHIYGQAFEDKYQEYEKLAEAGKIRVWKKVKASQIWRKMVTMIFETGHPWITFKDPCNVRSPQDHVGVVHNSNLCTEITLNNSDEETAVCNLGSVNLSEHFDAETKDLDRKKIKDTIHTAMRMLDNVIDINLYPTQETDTSNSRHRPVGMGIMGFHDLLYKKNLNFDSQEAVDFSDELMELVSYHAIMGSSELAAERGAYSSFKGSKWDRNLLPVDTLDLLEQERGEKIEVSRESRLDWTPVRDFIKAHGMRNSNCMAIAPTATIANISGCVPCIEPIYKNLYVKSNMGGEFTVINNYLVEELKARELWSSEMLQKLKGCDGSVQDILEIPQDIRDKYKEVFEVGAQWIIQHAAMRGKWIDQAQSTNIFYKGSSGKEISDVYTNAWKMGLKTTYYCRTLGATQVEKSTVNLSAQKGSQHGDEAQKKDYSEAEKVVCSIMNGDQCEACQ